MENSFEMPDFIKARFNELEELCRKHPIEMPLIEAAKFLHMHPESLRIAIIQDTSPFPAFAWKKPGCVNYAFHIPTFTFYQHLIGGRIQ